ncbi:MAG: serine/threonine-protein kinase [Candidatus Margulisbacteria bacterium]|nr:serine/threonine-protein kinase [Candidatus Margulisiibacteriota bacterium]
MDQILKSRYKISDKISETPFSVTYRGSFIGTDKPVIIKIYKRGTLNSLLIREMKQKVLGLSLLNHHGVAKLFDGDYGWQGFYYVREQIEGESLQAIMQRKGKIDIDKAMAIADQALTALEAAHEKGILHAGLKPTNIFVDNQGIVKLTDFVVQGEIKDSLPQKIFSLMDNGQYTSPEELEGKPLSPAADVFSLGMIIYEMVSGKPALLEKGLAGSIKKMKIDGLVPKEELAPLPPYLKDVLTKALRKDPLLRFPTANDFRQSLEKKMVIAAPVADQELAAIFENIVTQYGGEEIDSNSELLQEVGRINIRWGKEKHRNWILAVFIAAAVALGILYAFFFAL